LAGYRFRKCQPLLPNVELWKAIDPTGNRRQVVAVSGYAADPAALDALLSRLKRLRHAMLAPSEVFAHDGRLVIVSDPPKWPLAGHPPAVLGARYVAPELFEGIPTPTSDQYGLAVVYQELLTGTHPFHHLTPRQMTSPRQRGKPDLGMLPGADRAAVLRALEP